jgi:hypothetical protein
MSIFHRVIKRTLDKLIAQKARNDANVARLMSCPVNPSRVLIQLTPHTPKG